MTQAKAPTNGGVAIVLSGAGARGAYEAGALSVLLPFLKGDDCPRMVLGTSAGALNAAILASYLHLRRRRRSGGTARRVASDHTGKGLLHAAAERAATGGAPAAPAEQAWRRASSTPIRCG